MSFASIDGIRLFYRLEGRDDVPTIIFSHSLGVDHGQWDHQAADLLPDFRVLRYDLRGHGVLRLDGSLLGFRHQPRLRSLSGHVPTRDQAPARRFARPSGPR